MGRRTNKKQARTSRSANPKTLKDLVADPHNARRHTDRNLAMIAESIETVGAARSIVIDEGGRVLAGNATRLKAQEKGLKLKVVDADGKTVIAVRRRGLDATQKTALALYDNRAAELAEWDGAVLRGLIEAGVPLATFFRDEELEIILMPDEPLQEELDETIANDVRQVTCPHCKKRFPL